MEIFPGMKYCRLERVGTAVAGGCANVKSKTQRQSWAFECKTAAFLGTRGTFTFKCKLAECAGDATWEYSRFCEGAEKEKDMRKREIPRGSVSRDLIFYTSNVGHTREMQNSRRFQLELDLKHANLPSTARPPTYTLICTKYIHPFSL